MSLPSVKQLQYLVSLHEFGHFGRAATACNVSQSTLSAGLKELEATLGTRLVERSRRQTLFTPLGARVAVCAQDVLLRARELSELARSFATPLSGRLRMSVSPAIAPFLLPKMLPALAQAFPRLEIEPDEEVTSQACDALMRGERDCVLLAVPYPCESLDYLPLFTEDFVVVVHRDDPLAQQSEIRLRDLPEERLLLLDDGSIYGDRMLAACGQKGLRRNRMRRCSINTLLNLVDAAAGVALVPALAVLAGFADRRDVVFRPLQAAEARTIALAWRRNSLRSEEFPLLAQQIKKLNPEHQDPGWYSDLTFTQINGI